MKAFYYILFSAAEDEERHVGAWVACCQERGGLLLWRHISPRHKERGLSASGPAGSVGVCFQLRQLTFNEAGTSRNIVVRNSGTC